MITRFIKKYEATKYNKVQEKRHKCYITQGNKREGLLVDPITYNTTTHMHKTYTGTVGGMTRSIVKHSALSR